MIILRQKEYSFRDNTEELIELTNEYRLVRNDDRGFIAKLLGKIPSIKKSQDSWALYDLYHSSQKKSIGFVSIGETNNGSDLEIGWIAVNNLPEPIMTKIVKSIINLGKKCKYNNIIVDVFDDTPDDIELYKKLGFKELGYDSVGSGSYKHGYTKMKLKL